MAIPHPGSNYRLMALDEIIKEGDLYFSAKDNDWQQVEASIGSIVRIRHTFATPVISIADSKADKPITTREDLIW